MYFSVYFNNNPRGRAVEDPKCEAFRYLGSTTNEIMQSKKMEAIKLKLDG